MQFLLHPKNIRGGDFAAGLKIVTSARYHQTQQDNWNEARRMLQNLNDQVRDCVKRAADCAENAKQVADPRERDEWLALKSRYLAIANGIESHYRSPTFKGVLPWN